MPASTRVVVVTGGGTGIGRAVADMFCRQRCAVVIMGRREDVLEAAAQEMGAEHQRLDVANRVQVAAAIDKVVQRHGRVDVLVNMAGLVRPVSIDSSLEEAESVFDEVIGVNLRGSYLMSVACAQHMPAGGRILFVSSIAAFTGGRKPGLSCYAAAKSGLHGLTYSLARELGPRGITVNAIAPGFIRDTELFGPEPTERSEERARQQILVTAVGRSGTVEDIANAVRYLAAPEASFVTGEIHHVTGGSVFGR